MITLCTTARITEVSIISQDANLQTLLQRRIDQLEQDGDDVGDLASFLVVGPGDSPAAVEAELGFSLLENFVDGVRYGDADFEPSWEWIEHHTGWFEFVFVLSDDGFGWVVFVKDDEGVDATILTLCREYAPAA